MLEIQHKYDAFKASFQQHQAKAKLALAKKRSAENSLQAVSKQQALKLTAKKKQIER